jgi:phage-related baseplate assembly protein
MAETLPRWDLPEVSFVETDPEAIKAEIVSRYENAAGRTLATADPIRIFLLAVADEIIQQRVLINMAAQSNLLSYATGEYLDALGEYLLVSRLPASKAVTNIRFTLSQALEEVYVIPAGTEITNGIVTFATDEELVIAAGDLTGDVSASCTVAGVAGNGYLPGQISTIVRPMTFVDLAENTNATYGGADIESDEDYAERIRLAPNAFSVAGPIKAYVFYTQSVSSAIIDVSIDSPTPGVVNVYPLLEGGVIPDQTLLDKVLEKLSAEDVRPLTDDVHALQAEAVTYTINVRYFIKNSDKNKAETIRTNVAAAVENYRLWQQGKIGRDIVPAELVRAVMNAGAARLDNTLSPNAFRELTKTQVAQCDKDEGVTVTFGGFVEG